MYVRGDLKLRDSGGRPQSSVALGFGVRSPPRIGESMARANTSNLEFHELVTKAAEKWAAIATERGGIEHIPETAQLVISSAAIYRESRILRWLTVALVGLTIILATLTGILAYRMFG